MAKTTLALIFGGRSPEHEVSLVSARGIYANLDRARFDVVLVYVERTGRPVAGGEALLGGAAASASGRAVRWPAYPGDRTLRDEVTGEAVTPPLDVAFPIIHGSGGEDGTLQGALALAGIACVGPGVLGSSLAMDKDRARRLFAAAGLPVVRDVVFELPHGGDASRVLAEVATLGWPVFVKPARAGSSVGITKVKGPDGLPAAIAAARAFDTKVVIEEGVPDAREIEVAVLGNLEPQASVPGEIVPHAEFYDYDAKYNDPGSRLLIPAPLAPDEAARLQRLALDAFRAVDGLGMSRVDFLLSRTTGRLVLNEINTLPGFTPISMYPRLWEASGLPYPALLTRLAELALEALTLGPLAGR